MTSIITGDIINSRNLSKDWLEVVKTQLSKYGKSPGDWELFRGDQFQLEVSDPADALQAALEIKAGLKKIKVGVRISIGIGDKIHSSKKVSESNGSAFIRSGETFETLKKLKTTLAINSGNADFDRRINLMLKLALTIMDHWLVQSAEFFLTAYENRSWSQEEIGAKLGISQAAVSRRRKRSHYDLIVELEVFYRDEIKMLAP